MADIVFAIDVSGSIRRERFYIVQDFVKNITKNLEVGQDKTRIGVVSWSDDAAVNFNLNQFSQLQDVLQVGDVAVLLVAWEMIEIVDLCAIFFN